MSAVVLSAYVRNTTAFLLVRVVNHILSKHHWTVDLTRPTGRLHLPRLNVTYRFVQRIVALLVISYSKLFPQSHITTKTELNSLRTHYIRVKSPQKRGEIISWKGVQKM